MRRNNPAFLLFLAILSVLSGWLMSRMSWIGRMGINLFHKEYRFLKVWYRGAGAVFATLLALFLIQWLLDRKLPRMGARATQLAGLAAAICGLWLTYSDFRTDFSHSILKERFHLGAYLFWIGWMCISLYLLVTVRRQRAISEVQVERSH
jgi:hypothetical protein